MAHFQTVCQVADLSDGQAKMVAVGETVIGVYRVNGDFFALHDQCPHAGASLAHGYVEDCVVACRMHHWQFRICDGTYLDADRPEFNVRAYPVRVVGSDVQVEL